MMLLHSNGNESSSSDDTCNNTGTRHSGRSHERLSSISYLQIRSSVWFQSLKELSGRQTANQTARLPQSC